MTIRIILLIFLLVMILCFTIFAGILVLGPLVTGFKKAPYVPSFDYHLRIMKKKLHLKRGAHIVDLGCGDGKALRFFDKEFGLKGTGYDLNPFVILYGKFSNRLLGYKNITLIRSNFKKAQLKNYEYIYIYLWPEQLVFIEDWMFAHISEKTIIISNSFKFVKHMPFDIINDEHNKKAIYLYKK
ncbi:MAG: class I SAM-dependent methyltransferase [candidate division SR1 bacterium]|nr:class I SAM-dependent methyltransferase [candidate division SR1 bacterium]